MHGAGPDGIKVVTVMLAGMPGPVLLYCTMTTV